MPIVICLTRRDNCLNEASRFSHIQLYFDGIEFFIHDNTFSIIVRELDRFNDYLKKHLLMIVNIAGPFKLRSGSIPNTQTLKLTQPEQNHIKCHKDRDWNETMLLDGIFEKEWRDSYASVKRSRMIQNEHQLQVGIYVKSPRWVLHAFLM